MSGIKKRISSPRHSDELLPRVERDSEPTMAFADKGGLEQIKLYAVQLVSLVLVGRLKVD